MKSVVQNTRGAEEVEIQRVPILNRRNQGDRRIIYIICKCWKLTLECCLRRGDPLKGRVGGASQSVCGWIITPFSGPKRRG